VTPNSLAWLALYAWPVLALGVYAARRERSSLARTTAWMMLIPVMFLPAMIELPFAALNKHRIAFLSIAAALFFFHRREILAPLRDDRFALGLLMVVAFGAVQTAATNRDPVTFGVLRLPGLTLRDSTWMTYGFFVDAVLPFLIGRRVFRTEDDVRDLLDVLSKAALVYAPLCLVELRVSPQLSNWVYGYFPHSFGQAIRGSGYRPVVFMNHGLSVGMFLLTGFCAALALHRSRAKTTSSPRLRATVAGSLVLLAGNLGSVVYALAAFPLLIRRSAMARTAAAMLVAAGVAAYPVVRSLELVPVERIGSIFARVNQERSSSLMFRFSQEEILLARALERPLYGWGGWGRSRIYHWWGEPGQEWAGATDSSVTDGTWIIVLGGSGIFGFVGLFALLLVPLVQYVRHRKMLHPNAEGLYGGVAIIVAVSAADLLPNSQSDFLPLVYAGVLFALGASAPLSRPIPGVR
jgi:hypothetical protein